MCFFKNKELRSLITWFHMYQILRKFQFLLLGHLNDNIIIYISIQFFQVLMLSLSSWSEPTNLMTCSIGMR